MTVMRPVVAVFVWFVWSDAMYWTVWAGLWALLLAAESVLFGVATTLLTPSIPSRPLAGEQNNESRRGRTRRLSRTNTGSSCDAEHPNPN